MNSPMVYLVGAGPGDTGLITVRGLELIKIADVIVYDQLGTTGFICEAKKDCELIDVGKYSGNHKFNQDCINDLLIEKARENKLVVRLKGGDPFVFGRGGEELLYLTKQGISAEIVPGVTSAISAPCYAGIPITQRGYTSSVVFVTGHEAAKENSDINWPALAGIGTLVFLMGVKNLPIIVKNLIDNGKPPDTPVAMIENGSLPFQRVITGNLETIVVEAEKEHIKTPAITVVGHVVSLRNQLKWFENRPLFGKTIIVTRSRHQASKMVQQLTLLGANVLECPTIKIIQHHDSEDFKTFVNESSQYSHLVFTSVNGVEGFIESLLKVGLDLRILGNKKIVCIGPSTAEAFKSRGIMPDFVPENYIAESLLPYFEKLAPSEVAILRAEIAREILPDTLVKLGHNVTVVPLYHTEYETPNNPEVIEALKNGKVDLVTFTSSSTVEGFAKILKNASIETKSVKSVSIGPITTKTCNKYGFNLVIEAKTHTIPGLISAICDWNNKK